MNKNPIQSDINYKHMSKKCTNACSRGGVVQMSSSQANSDAEKDRHEDRNREAPPLKKSQNREEPGALHAGSEK